MRDFDKLSNERLETCHPELKLLFRYVIRYLDCMVACGHRNEAEQNKVVATGYSQIKWPNGKHNAYPSNAVDVYPTPVKLHSKNEREKEIYKIKMAYFAGQVKAIARQLKENGLMKHDLIWGNDWDDDGDIAEHNFLDYCHFELKL